MKRLRHYSDPGHGWVPVKRQTLLRLGIAHKVSPYSYQRGQTVYLEEDCDAGLLIQALGTRGDDWDWDLDRSSYTDRRHPIRSYASFELSPIEQTISETSEQAAREFGR
jgi:hypothetical protein